MNGIDPRSMKISADGTPEFMGAISARHRLDNVELEKVLQAIEKNSGDNSGNCNGTNNSGNCQNSSRCDGSTNGGRCFNLGSCANETEIPPL